MHDEYGSEIDASRDDYYAWSAAFISYVMRAAGAGARFPYSPSHYVYINIAKEVKLSRTSGWVVVAELVDEYAPMPGDLICYSRERYKLTYKKLPRRRFHRALPRVGTQSVPDLLEQWPKQLDPNHPIW